MTKGWKEIAAYSWSPYRREDCLVAVFQGLNQKKPLLLTLLMPLDSSWLMVCQHPQGLPEQAQQLHGAVVLPPTLSASLWFLSLVPHCSRVIPRPHWPCLQKLAMHFCLCWEGFSIKPQLEFFLSQKCSSSWEGLMMPEYWAHTQGSVLKYAKIICLKTAIDLHI